MEVGMEAKDFKHSDGAGWDHCVKHHQDFKAGAKFVPFGVEISGELGLVAQQFFDGAQRWIRATHDTSLYHWTAPSFRRFWTQRLGVSLVNSRAKVGMVVAHRDWANTFARSGIASMAPPL
jgi:hypothetical protein